MAQKTTYSTEYADPDFADPYPDPDYDDYSDPDYDDDSQMFWAYDEVQDFCEDYSDSDFMDEVQEFIDCDDIQIIKQPQQKTKKKKKKIA